MRLLAFTVFLLMAQLSWAQQQQALPEKAGYTFAAFALLVGNYYVAHDKWPSSAQQLREYTTRLARQFPPGERDIIPTVWSHIKHAEFTPRGKDLLVSARFRSEGRDYRHAAVLHPGKSSEEIVDRMSPK